MAVNFIKTINVNAAHAVTTTTANSTLFTQYIDLANYEGCCFLAQFKSTGASTGHCTFTVVGADSSTTAKASATAVNGASVTVEHSTTANAKRAAGIDVYRPQYRYVAAKFAKEAGILLTGCFALRYGPRVQPVAASTTYAAATAAASFDLVVEGT